MGHPPSLVCRRFDSKKRSARAIAGDQWSLIGYQVGPSNAVLDEQALAMTLTAAVLAPVDVNAQMIGQPNSGQAVGAVTPSNGAAGVTGKERLSEKWKDEQRIDNCKVPMKTRGQGAAR